ncbi:3D domain-containing protein [Marinilactibacillus piezotolerans]|uniref:3D domain-containing protein n=1 Tax=Marinilactibacillus piezotolerans TaxID=258723 RepID=UPI0009B02377|nr:3D domain-containing protein [Marinilactibacillus piezotolerans]
MKKWITGFAVLVLSLIQVFGAQAVSADSLDDIRQQQEQKQTELDSLAGKVAEALEETSAISEEISLLDSKVAESEETIQKKEAEIETQKEIVEARMDQASERLQALQVNDVNSNVVMAILEAESLSDLFNRTLAVMQLTDAGNQHIEDAQTEAEKLADLKAELLAEQESLKEDLAKVSEQKESYDKKLASLQTLVKENEAELSQLQEQEESEIAKVEAAREAARAEAVKAAAERAEEEVVTTSSSSNDSTVEAAEVEEAVQTETRTETAPAEKTAASEPASEKSSSSESGRTIQVSATGYSTQQPNLSTHTRTGIDLRVNPRVIAVDPSIIPLNSLVEIPGKGVYIAGDTGSAIKGNKIDIHFSTVGEALSWGRRTITIRVLN